MKKKNLTRALCALLAAVTAFSFTSCDELLGDLLNELTPSIPSISTPTDDKMDENGGGDSQNGNTDENGENNPENPENPKEPEEPGVPEEPEIVPTPDAPDESKVVDYEELDDIGHKVVYYTDGTWEDLGRAVALKTSTPAPETQYGYQYFSALEDGEGLCGFYDSLYRVYTQFHNGSKDLTINADGRYEVADVNFASHGISAEQAIAVWKIFLAENPLYYWSDNIISYGSKSMVLFAEPDYALADTRTEINEAIYQMALDCDSYLSGKTSVTERALTIYDYLATRVEYAYKADGITPEDAAWAHNIVGATQGKGVCETYAKAYDYLCGLFGLDCMMVVGVAVQDGTAGGHAWNILNLEDEWYNVDVTWADQETLTREWFGQRTEFFETTHVADKDTPWGIKYQYDLPTLAKDGLCPVLFGEENGEKTMVKSIDQAFDEMQNEQGRYEITLYPSTTVTAKKELKVSLTGASFTREILPKAASITFLGVKVKVTMVSYYMAELSAGSVTLNSAVTMDKVQFEYTSLNKNGYTLKKNNW